eukprot:COSAG05_NODE_16594_length_342_cov_1.053498_1_plen_39_part_10
MHQNGRASLTVGVIVDVEHKKQSNGVHANAQTALATVDH